MFLKAQQEKETLAVPTQVELEVDLSNESVSAFFQNSTLCTAHHLVRVGDTLATIGLTHNVSLPELAKANGIEISGLIQVGQRLCVPGSLASPTPTAVVTNPRPAARPTVSFGGTYTVQSGDTLAAIALTPGVSMNALMEFNGITGASKLQVGQKLQLLGSSAIDSPTPAPVAASPAGVVTPVPTIDLFTVQFLNNMTLSGSPVFVKTDRVGWSYDWGLKAPAEGVNRDIFSASWDGIFLSLQGPIVSLYLPTPASACILPTNSSWPFGTTRQPTLHIQWGYP